MPAAVADQSRRRTTPPGDAPFDRASLWPARIPRMLRLARRRWRAFALVPLVALVAVAIGAWVFLASYQPLELDAFVTCCGDLAFLPRPSPIAVGSPSTIFVVVARLSNTSGRGVRIDSVAPENPRPLGEFVRRSVVGLIADRDAGLGAPFTPLRPFELRGHQSQDVIFRGDISRCPTPVGGSSVPQDLQALVVRWSDGPIHHTTHLALNRLFVFHAGPGCA